MNFSKALATKNLYAVTTVSLLLPTAHKCLGRGLVQQPRGLPSHNFAVALYIIAHLADLIR